MDWILDTGAFKHLCANKDLFHQFEDAVDGECLHGNSGSLLNRAGLKLVFESDKVIISLSDVLHG